MPIDPVGGPDLARVAASSHDLKAAPVAPVRAVAGVDAPDADRAIVSADARALAAARQAVASAPDVRQDKVDAIKERIANGTYEVSPRQLAQKLLRHVADPS